jgi:hypothetical protein
MLLIWRYENYAASPKLMLLSTAENCALSLQYENFMLPGMAVKRTIAPGRWHAGT